MPDNFLIFATDPNGEITQHIEAKKGNPMSVNEARAQFWKTYPNADIEVTLSSDSSIKIDTSFRGVYDDGQHATYEDHVVIISHIDGMSPDGVEIKNTGNIEDLIARVSEFQFKDKYGQDYFDDIREEFDVQDDIDNVELIKNHAKYGIPDVKVMVYVDAIASSQTGFSGPIFKITAKPATRPAI